MKEKKDINKETNHIGLLKIIASILVDANSSGSSSVLDEILLELQNSAQVDGSGINQDDLGGHGTIPFDSGIKLMFTDFDETAGITYVGYATPDTNPGTGAYIIQKTVTTTVGNSEINTLTYGTGAWDDRKTTVNYY